MLPEGKDRNKKKSSGPVSLQPGHFRGDAGRQIDLPQLIRKDAPCVGFHFKRLRCFMPAGKIQASADRLLRRVQMAELEYVDRHMEMNSPGNGGRSQRTGQSEMQIFEKKTLCPPGIRIIV
jgi:hypothetical protein